MQSRSRSFSVLSLLLLTACPDSKHAALDGASSSDAGADDGAAHGGSKMDAGKPSKSDAGKPTTTPTDDDAGQAAADGGAMPAADGGGSKLDAGGGSMTSGDAGAAQGDGGLVNAPGARFFLPTDPVTNTTAPRVAIDQNGGTHTLYPSHAGGDAWYAYCPKGCSGPDALKLVRLPTDGTADDAALAITPDGKPRVVMATLQHIYFAQCDQNCTEQANWTISSIVETNDEKDVTGNALALDPNGHPRFIMHTYLAYLGVGQKTPATWFMQCDANCNDPASWRQDQIQDQIWYDSELHYDAMGRAHLATAVVDTDKGGPKMAAYVICEKDCTTADAWSGTALTPLFESDAEEVRPSLSMALTKAGQPRVIALDQDDQGQRRLVYFECDDGCDGDHWMGTKISDNARLGSGVGMAVDAQDRPNFVFTLGDNIGLYACGQTHCAGEDAKWTLNRIEFATDLPKDNIILWPNCTIDAWILHTPSLAIASDGAVRVGYQATDLSGGTTVTDPTAPACVAGKDMTLSRLALTTASQ